MPVDATLDKLLRRAEYASLSNENAVSTLNAMTVTKTDTTRKNYVAIATHFDDPAKVTALDTALGQAGLGWVQRTMGGEGLNFADPLTAQTIDALVAASKISLQDGAALKAIGTWQASPYQEAGGVGTVTLQQVIDTRAFIARDVLKHDVATRYNHMVGKIDSGEVVDIAGAIAEFGA